MKRRNYLQLLVVALLIVDPFAIPAQAAETPEQIPYKEALINPPSRPRSIGSRIDVWYDADERSIDLFINEMFGVIQITITDSFGNTYYSANVDTNTTSAIQIPAPTDEGAYTIAIIGSGYYGCGAFII